MLYGILLFFSFLESIVGFNLMSSSTMAFREPVRKRITAGFLVMLCGMSLFFGTLFSKGFYVGEEFAILIILGVFLAWYLICSGDSFFVSLFNFLTFINIYVSISFISDSLTIHWSGVKYMGEYILIRTAIYGTIIPLLFKFVRPRFRRLVEALDKEWRAATLVPFIFLVLQIFLLYYPVPYWKGSGSNWFKIIAIITYLLFLAVYYLLYIQANAIVEKYSMEKRELLMAQQNKLWESELDRQKTMVALAAKQWHDMRHHNAAIMGMLQNGDLEGLSAYMRSFETELNAHNADRFCTHPIINSFLNTYARRAREQRIKTKFQVSVPESIGIDNIDLTCVFGNALENALEGCLRLPSEYEKEISVTVKFIDYRLRLQVENSCREDIEFHDELPITQKQSGGTGIKSIIYTAERYDGTAGFSVREGKFITQIVLNTR